MRRNILRWSGSMALLAMLPASLPAQTRSQLGYDGNTDSGYLRLRGTDGQSASRLWVSGGDDNRSILQLYDAGQQWALFLVDSAGQATLVLFDSSDSEAVRLYVDNGTDHGQIRGSDDGGDIKADLFVDGAEQGGRSERDEPDRELEADTRDESGR